MVVTSAHTESRKEQTMRSWYKVVKDVECKDGTTIKMDVLTFETTDKDVSKRVEEFFKSLMDERGR